MDKALRTAPATQDKQKIKKPAEYTTLLGSRVSLQTEESWKEQRHARNSGRRDE